MMTSRLVSRVRAPLGLLTGLLLAGCPADEDQMSNGSATSPSDDDDATTTGPDVQTDSIDPSLSATGMPETDGSATEPDPTLTSSDTNESNFIVPPDGGPANECDIWAQDCPEGEKCMPWDNMGGNSWNATRCSPVAPDPGQPGDPCTVEGSGVSGVDDCAISSMCWNVDPDTNQGVCVGFCEGSENNPVCPDPDTGCSITNEGVLILCLPYCDPLLQDCSDSEACYPEPNGFFCSPDASGKMGMYGDPCEYLNVCDPGLFCADAVNVPDCAGAIGCCSEYCDTSDPMAVCMGNGQECLPFYEDAPPPGYEDVGVCIIPQ
jgi:hypothetical protein